MRNGKRLSILIITLGMLLAGCGKSEQADASIPELLEPVSVAENTIQVKRQDFYFADYIDVTVVPQMEELYFVMDGEILEIEVKEGQLVKEGDVLAKIDQTHLNDAIKELQETIAYEDKIYNMQLTQADLDVQIAEAKLSKLQAEYDEQEQKKAEEAKKKAEEEAKKKAEAEAAKDLLKQQAELSTDSAKLRQEVASYALNFVGNPYKWGGTSLTKGADCSGFVQSIYKQFGYELPRVSKDQAKSAGYCNVTPDLNHLLPGDLIFYTNSKGVVDHVAMYIGDGKIVHAASKKDGIKISSYKTRTPYKARRVIQ